MLYYYLDIRVSFSKETGKLQETSISLIRNENNIKDIEFTSWGKDLNEAFNNVPSVYNLDRLKRLRKEYYSSYIYIKK